MADKPLARRLDDIEDKMDQVLDINDKLIKHLDGFQENLSSIDTDLIKETMQKAILDAVESSNAMPNDWMVLVNYCMKKDISADTMLQFARILSGDFRKDKGYEDI